MAVDTTPWLGAVPTAETLFIKAATVLVGEI